MELLHHRLLVLGQQRVPRKVQTSSISLKCSPQKIVRSLPRAVPRHTSCAKWSSWFIHVCFLMGPAARWSCETNGARRESTAQRTGWVK
eukprot:2522604-Rhodomonas_salina.1